jgi:hypothetical protein
MNMARSLLKEKNLSNDFWGEVIACYVYVLKWSPTKSVKNKVPQESWSGMKCSVSHFRVFGCVAYSHVLEEIRTKLDEISEKYIFTIYIEQSKVCKLYNVITKKFRISRVVEFKEIETWDGSVDKTMTTREKIPHGKVDVEEKSEQEKQQGTQVQSLVQGTPTRTPRIQGDLSRQTGSLFLVLSQVMILILERIEVYKNFMKN